MGSALVVRYSRFSIVLALHTRSVQFIKYNEIFALISPSSLVTSHVIMPRTTVPHYKNLCGYMKLDTRKSFHGTSRRSSTTHYLNSDFANKFHSCLAHVINLAMQTLISTYSKAPHYSPHDPKGHEPDSSQKTSRDEIGLVRSICVKVCQLVLHPCLMLYTVVLTTNRSVHLQSVKSCTRLFRQRQGCLCQHSCWLTWRFAGHRHTSCLIALTPTRRYVSGIATSWGSSFLTLIIAYWHICIRDGSARVWFDETCQDWLFAIITYWMEACQPIHWSSFGMQFQFCLTWF
jgi:hypothetical protein